jgi:hypothetical protein
MAWLMFAGIGVGVGLMLKRVDFRSDLGLKNWFYLGLKMVSDLMFEVGV